MTRDCLLVLNPRRIPDCIASLEALPIDKAWLTGYTEVELCDVIAEVIEGSEYGHYIVVSDDAIVPRGSLHAVRMAGTSEPVVTGYSNLSLADWRVNLCKTPLRGDTPQPDAYDLYTYQEVVASGGRYIRTHFAGMCLTRMRRSLWQRFPFDCFGKGGSGYASDFNLSRRLAEAGIPIVAPRDAFVLHVKERWNQADRAPEKKLLLGSVTQEVRWDLQ